MRTSSSAGSKRNRYFFRFSSHRTKTGTTAATPTSGFGFIAGLSPEKISALKRTYRLLYRSKLSLEEALARIEKEVATEEALYLVNFIRQSERGICRE